MSTQDIRNLSEAYMEVYGEAYKPFPKEKVDKKLASKAVKAAKHQFSATWGNPSKSSENQEKADKLGSQAKTLFQISTETNKEANARSRGIKSKHRSEVKRKIRFMDDIARQKRESGYGSTTKKEEVDIYDIILSHLLDEGYAETVEAAEVMMVSMSEDWRESIVEEMLDEGEKPLPYGRMMKKSNQLADKGEGKRAAKIYLAANSPKGPKVKVRK